MPEPKYKRLASKVEDLYWDHTAGEIQEKLDIGGSTYQRAIEYVGLPRKTNDNWLEHLYGVPCDWLLDTLHNTLEMPAIEMAEQLPVSRKWISNYMDENGIPRRGQSEAESLKWEQMSQAQREKQIKEAHDKVRELVSEGEHALQQWRKENPSLAQEHSKRVAPLGAPEREENGMAGVTGQDHPRWRGGKSIYDAVKKQLRPSFASVKDDYRSEECYSCGASDCKLDVHHIIPILSGGTNGEWNMMTLCESCHSQVEWFTRDLVEPVLIE